MHKKLRRLVVDGKTYLWRNSVGYKKEPLGDPPHSWSRHALFVAYQLGMKNSPLYLFVNWEDPPPGNVLDLDVVLDIREINADGASLYVMPERAAKLIRLALKNGWQPELSRKPFKRLVFSPPFAFVQLGPPSPME